MELEIKKLTIDLLDDWLNFFDNNAFSDDDDWPGCYCMHFHWNAGLDSRNSWDASLEQVYRKTGKADNRGRAIRLIKKGTMQGYLAYHNGTVVGWCNANDKHKYNTVLNSFFGNADKERKVKSVVCFTVSSKARRKGIASKLLEKVCADALEEGYEYVEAYPMCDNRYGPIDFQGSVTFFEKHGFEKSGHKMDDSFIVRKNLM